MKNGKDLVRMFEECCYNEITNMSMMFATHKIQYLDLSYIDTSNVTDMSMMFFGCENLKLLDVCSFDTSNVTDMRDMFWDCKSLKSLDLSSFDITLVSYVGCIFEGCTSLKTLRVKSGTAEWWTARLNECGIDAANVGIIEI